MSLVMMYELSGTPLPLKYVMVAPAILAPSACPVVDGFVNG